MLYKNLYPQNYIAFKIFCYVTIAMTQGFNWIYITENKEEEKGSKKTAKKKRQAKTGTKKKQKLII